MLNFLFGLLFLFTKLSVYKKKRLRLIQKSEKMTTCFMFMNKKFMLINFLFRNSESPASKMRLVKNGDFLLFWGLRYGPYVPYASPASASRFAPYASALNFVLRYGPYVPYASPAAFGEAKMPLSTSMQSAGRFGAGGSAWAERGPERIQSGVSPQTRTGQMTMSTSGMPA